MNLDPNDQSPHLKITLNLSSAEVPVLDDEQEQASATDPQLIQALGALALAIGRIEAQQEEFKQQLAVLAPREAVPAMAEEAEPAVAPLSESAANASATSEVAKPLLSVNEAQKRLDRITVNGGTLAADAEEVLFQVMANDNAASEGGEVNASLKFDEMRVAQLVEAIRQFKEAEERDLIEIAIGMSFLSADHEKVVRFAEQEAKDASVLDFNADIAAIRLVEGEGPDTSAA